MIDLERDWLVVERDGQVVGHSRAAAACARRRQGQGVHRGRRSTPSTGGPGSARTLVPLMVARAHEYARERGLEAVVAASAPSTNTDLEAVFAKVGLRPERWQFEMVADLHEEGVGAEPPTVPDGYTLATWEGIDQDEMRAAHNRAFVDHYGFSPWGADMWRQWVSGSRNYRPELSLVLRDDAGRCCGVHPGQRVRRACTRPPASGTCSCRRWGPRPSSAAAAWPDSLLRIALHRYRQAGFDQSSLGVDSENPTGALAVYERAGFRTTMRWTNYGWSPKPGRAAPRRCVRRRARGSARGRTPSPSSTAHCSQCGANASPSRAMPRSIRRCSGASTQTSTVTRSANRDAPQPDALDDQQRSRIHHDPLGELPGHPVVAPVGARPVLGEGQQQAVELGVDLRQAGPARVEVVHVHHAARPGPARRSRLPRSSCPSPPGRRGRSAARCRGSAGGPAPAPGLGRSRRWGGRTHQASPRPR